MIVWLAASTALAADTLSLSYEQALEQALAVNPALAGARLDVDAADGALIAANARSCCCCDAGPDGTRYYTSSMDTTPVVCLLLGTRHLGA